MDYLTYCARPFETDTRCTEPLKGESHPVGAGGFLGCCWCCWFFVLYNLLGVGWEILWAGAIQGNTGGICLNRVGARFGLGIELFRKGLGMSIDLGGGPLLGV